VYREPLDAISWGPQRQYALTRAWVELTSILIVNRSSAMEGNGSKPYQLRLIQESGFAVPDNLITTDRNAVEQFWRKHGLVIYKSIRGARSIVAQLTPRHIDRLELVRWCPTQFQSTSPATIIECMSSVTKCLPRDYLDSGRLSIREPARRRRGGFDRSRSRVKSPTVVARLPALSASLLQASICATIPTAGGFASRSTFLLPSAITSRQRVRRSIWRLLDCCKPGKQG
jgi:hypothetical protein